MWIVITISGRKGALEFVERSSESCSPCQHHGKVNQVFIFHIQKLHTRNGEIQWVKNTTEISQPHKCQRALRWGPWFGFLKHGTEEKE